jgi:hypothetical protein
MTSTGFLLIPLGCLLILQQWPIVLMALPAFALLHGAAVINVGSVGLQPGYFLALLVIVRTLLEIGLLRHPLNHQVLIQLVPIALLLVVSTIALWVAIVMFDGRVLVMSGTDRYDLNLVAPYSFRRENVAQIVYLTIDFLLVYSVAHQIARLSCGDSLRVVDGGIVVAILISILICLWQIYSYYTGAYFAEDFFFSNVGYARADNQAFFGYLRLNGPFTEPSALAYFFSGFLFYSWQRYRLRPTPLSAGLVVACAASLFLAFSTTGFVALLVFVVLLISRVFVRLGGRIGPPVMTWRRLLSGLVVLLGATAALLLIVKHWSGVTRILDVALLEKDQSSSFAMRSAADLMAFKIVAQTYGLGIGLGSHKPNSLALTLLSNVGIVGTVMFAMFVAEVLRPRPFRAAAPRIQPRLNETPLRYFLLALLMAHAISNPNFNVVMLWIGFGLMTGCLGHVQTAAKGYFRPEDRGLEQSDYQQSSS